MQYLINTYYNIQQHLVYKSHTPNIYNGQKNIYLLITDVYINILCEIILERPVSHKISMPK